LFLQYSSAPSLLVRSISDAAEVLNRALSAWGNRLPGNPAALWTWCLEQDQDTLLRLLAYGMAQTVNAVQLKSDDPECERFVHADALQKALGIDMTSWFRPTAENYFGRVSKAGIIEALKEPRGTRCSRLGEGEEIRPRRHRGARDRRYALAARPAQARGLKPFRVKSGAGPWR
jgi:hypothetical protein